MKHKETFFQDYTLVPKLEPHWIVQYWDDSGRLQYREFATIEEAEDFEDLLNTESA